MTLEGKTLADISKDDIQGLVDNQVAEGKKYEFKEQLPGDSDKEKKEFLADVSSFSNASGGHLILGIKEKRGLASSLSGLELEDTDSALLRLESIIRDGIDPRIPGLSMRAVPVESPKVAIMIRIPRSWAVPHMVTFKGQSKFYSRNSAGKYQLDVHELRGLFLLSETTADRIRDFRTGRLAKIVAGETPVSVGDDPKMVLHMVPLAAFATATRLDVTKIATRWQLIVPMSSTGITGERYNFDGYLTHDRLEASGEGTSYLQIFRNGIIEAVDTRIMYFGKREKRPCIPSVAYEREILQALPRFLSVQQVLGVQPPVMLMLSFLGISGFVLSVKRNDFPPAEKDVIDRDSLLVPEVVLESFDVNPHHAMKPVFDAVWNASGWPGSLNYDKEGKWIGR